MLAVESPLVSKTESDFTSGAAELLSHMGRKTLNHLDQLCPY